MKSLLGKSPSQSEDLRYYTNNIAFPKNFTNEI